MQPETRKKVGLFGGTFDPIHLGHLILAEHSYEQAHLDELWFVPAASPPQKRDRAVTPFARRVEMLNLAIAGHPAFRVEEVEKEQSGLSYTAVTLQTLTQRYPAVDFHFIMGSDSALDLPSWYQPLRIVELARLVIVGRPNFVSPSEIELKAALGMPQGALLRLQVVEVPLIEISSTWLRQRAHEGKSLRYLVPRAVECYIQEKKLYPEPSS